jgi:hypothetical protein
VGIGKEKNERGGEGGEKYLGRFLAQRGTGVQSLVQFSTSLKTARIWGVLLIRTVKEGESLGNSINLAFEFRGSFFVIQILWYKAELVCLNSSLIYSLQLLSTYKQQVIRVNESSSLISCPWKGGSTVSQRSL